MRDTLKVERPAPEMPDGPLEDASASPLLPPPSNGGGAREFHRIYCWQVRCS